MDPMILLGIILASPVILLVLLRVNAAIVFLSACLGAVLVQFVSRDATAILASTSGHTHGMPTDLASVNLILQLLPVVLTTLIMIRSVKGGGKHFFNLLSAVAVAALLALLIVPLLPGNAPAMIGSTELWQQLENLQTAIVGAGTLLALFTLWLHRPKRRDDDTK